MIKCSGLQNVSECFNEYKVAYISCTGKIHFRCAKHLIPEWTIIKKKMTMLSPEEAKIAETMES